MAKETGRFVFNTRTRRKDSVTTFVVAPLWAFWFYALTGSLPRRADTIEKAWNRLSANKLHRALCFLAEWKARRALSFNDSADAIRARLPVPDAADLEQAAACLFRDDAIQPWVATVAAKAIYKHDEAKRKARRARALRNPSRARR